MLDDLLLSTDELRQWRDHCIYVANTLGDEPTTHDLDLARRHMPGCDTCAILFAQFYRNRRPGVYEGPQ